MATTIDAAGRVVIPKAIRDRLGISGGQELEISEDGEAIEIRLAPVGMSVKRQAGVLVAVPDKELPPVTADQVRDTLEKLRR